MEDMAKVSVVDINVDVCIIGCGLAGLAAAHFIADNSSKSCSIALIEARDRPGGRTCSVPIHNKSESDETDNDIPLVVDIGGQWIGADHARMVSILSKYGIELLDQYYPENEFPTAHDTYSLGSLISMVSYEFPVVLPEVMREVNAFVAHVDQLGGSMNLSEPWSFPNATQLDMSVYDYICTHIESPIAQQEIILFIQTIMACDPRNCSFLFFVYYIASGGGMRALGDGAHGAQKWKIPLGAQEISNRLLSDIQSRDNVHCFLGQPVGEVIFAEDGEFVFVHAGTTSLCSGYNRYKPTTTITTAAISATITTHPSVTSTSRAESLAALGAPSSSVQALLAHDILLSDPAAFSATSPQDVTLMSGSYMAATTTTTSTNATGAASRPASTVVKCRRVLLAMSPRLAINTVSFTPPYTLSSEKQALGTCMEPGSVSKVIVVYETPFWLENGLIQGQSSLRDISPVHNFFHAALGSYSALVGLITASTNESHGSKSPMDRRHAVLRQIYLLYRADEEKRRGTGEGGEGDMDDDRDVAFHPVAYMERNWSQEEYSGGCFACVFRPKSFCSYGPHLKTPTRHPFAEAAPSPVSEREQEISVTTDTHAVCQPLKEDTLSALEQQCTKKFADDVLFWASTETAPLFAGYMEGAVLAGEEAAALILASLE